MSQETTLFVVVAAAESQVQKRVEVLVRGSSIRIVGVGDLDVSTVPRIALLKPQVCLIDAAGDEDDSLRLARDVRRASPKTRVLLMGSQADAAFMARASVSGVWNYLPLVVSYPDFSREVAAAAKGERPAATSPFAKAVALLPMRPKRPASGGGRVVTLSRSCVDRCMSLGLSAEDMARHLGCDIEVVQEHMRRRAGRFRNGNSGSWSGFSKVLLASGLLVMGWLANVAWFAAGTRGPFVYHHVSGRILYEDGAVIPAESITLTFLAMEPSSDPKVRPRPGLAAVDPRSGRFGSVTSHRRGDGLVTGAHKVVVTGQDRLPLPSDVVAPEYADPLTTPLQVDASTKSFELRVKRPSRGDALPPAQ